MITVVTRAVRGVRPRNRIVPHCRPPRQEVGRVESPFSNRNATVIRAIPPRPHRYPHRCWCITRVPGRLCFGMICIGRVMRPPVVRRTSWRISSSARCRPPHQRRRMRANARRPGDSLRPGTRVSSRNDRRGPPRRRRRPRPRQRRDGPTVRIMCQAMMVKILRRLCPILPGAAVR